MVLKLCEFYVIAFFSAYLLTGILNPSAKFCFKRWRFGLYALTLSITVISFHFEPSVSDDLYRHFWKVRQVMSGNVWWGIEESSSLLLWGLMIQASAALKNVHFLPVISVSVTMFFWIQTLRFVSDRIRITNFTSLVYMLVCGALCSWIQLFSDLRCICAFSIVSFSVIRITLDSKQSKTNIALNVALLISATMIHPSSWIAILLLLFSSANTNSKILLVTVIAWGLVAPAAIGFIGKLNFGSLGLLVYKANSYITSENVMDARIVISEWLTVGILLGWYSLFTKNPKGKSIIQVSLKYSNWFIVISLFILSSLHIYVIIYRFCMLLAMTSLPSLYTITQRWNVLKTAIPSFVIIIACIGMIAYNYVHLFSHMMLV